MNKEKIEKLSTDFSESSADFSRLQTVIHQQCIDVISEICDYKNGFVIFVNGYQDIPAEKFDERSAYIHEHAEEFLCNNVAFAVYCIFRDNAEGKPVLKNIIAKRPDYRDDVIYGMNYNMAMVDKLNYLIEAASLVIKYQDNIDHV